MATLWFRLHACSNSMLGIVVRRRWHSRRGRDSFRKRYYISGSCLHLPSLPSQLLGHWAPNKSPPLDPPFHARRTYSECRTGEAMRCQGRRREPYRWNRKRRGSRPVSGGSASLRHFRKQRALWRREVRNVTPAQAAAVASAAAAAAVASEAPGSLQVVEEDPDPLLPQVWSGSKGTPAMSPCRPLPPPVLAAAGFWAGKVLCDGWLEKGNEVKSRGISSGAAWRLWVPGSQTNVWVGLRAVVYEGLLWMVPCCLVYKKGFSALVVVMLSNQKSIIFEPWPLRTSYQ